MTFEELLQKNQQAEGDQRLTWQKDQAYQGMSALYDDFNLAARSVDRPLRRELRDWLDTLDMLCANPPQTFELPVRRALARAEGLAGFLFRPTNGVRNYDLIKSALMSTNEEAGAQFDRHLKQINDYYGMGMNLNFIPDLEEPNFEPEPVPEPELEPAPETQEGQESESSAIAEDYTYQKFMDDIQADITSGSDTNADVNLLAGVSIVQGRIASGRGDERFDADAMRQEQQELMETDEFEQLTEDMDEEAIRQAILNPAGFNQQLEERGATIQAEQEPAPETVSETTPETPETSAVTERYTYQNFMDEMRGAVSSGSGIDLTRELLAGVSVVQRRVASGRGDEGFDADAMVQEQQELMGTDEFRQLTEGMDEEAIRQAILNAAGFNQQLEERRTANQASQETVTETAPETTQETAPDLQVNPEIYTYQMHLKDLQDAVTLGVDIGMSREEHLARMAAVHAHIQSGHGNMPVNDPALEDEMKEMQEMPAFRTLTRNMSDSMFRELVGEPEGINLAIKSIQEMDQETPEETSEPENQSEGTNETSGSNVEVQEEQPDLNGSMNLNQMGEVRSTDAILSDEDDAQEEERQEEERQEEGPVQEMTEPDIQETQEETQEEAPGTYTYQSFHNNLQGMIRSGEMGQIQIDTLLALSVAVQAHIQAGEAKDVCDMDSVIDEGNRLKDSEAFRQMIAGMDEADMTEAAKKPAEFYQRLEDKKAEIQAAESKRQEEQKQEEPKQEKPKEAFFNGRKIIYTSSGPMYAEREDSGEFNEFWTEEDEKEYQKEKRKEELGNNGNKLEGETDPEFQFEVVNPDDPENLKFPASVWLENFKAEASKNKDKYSNIFYIRDAKDLMTRILATRMAANAKRGDSGSLGKWLSQDDVDKAVEKLTSNPHYQDFLTKFGEMSGAGVKIRQKVMAGLDQGHGGRVEDVFKEYLRDLPGGKLDNSDPTIDHFMPTVKERIESLKNQAKASRHIAEEAAEIVVLRNMVHAERNKKSTLDKKIPMNGNLIKDQKTLTKSKTFNGICFTDESVRKAVTSGHGGEIVEKVLEAQKKLSSQVYSMEGYEKAAIGNGGFMPDSLKILTANTRGGRMDYLREQARSLEEQLQTAKGDKADQLALQSKEVMAEYLIHRQACMKNDKQLVDNLEEKLNETMAWGSLEKNIEKFKQNPKFQQMDFFPDDARKAMKNLAEGTADPVATTMDVRKNRLIMENDPVEQFVHNVKANQRQKKPQDQGLQP